MTAPPSPVAPWHESQKTMTPIGLAPLAEVRAPPANLSPEKASPFPDPADFASNLPGPLVFSQAQEYRLPKKSVISPLGKFYLRDQGGLEPGYLLHFGEAHS